MDNITYFIGANKNWGDRLNPIIYKNITGRDSHYKDFLSKDNTLCMIGSILDAISNENAIVWGSGCMFENGVISLKKLDIRAVRGKLSRERLLKNKISCPEIYGDPALLFPRFYNPIIEKKYKIGIIPHYVDKTNDWLIKNCHSDEIKIIDICSEAHEFVRQVKECDIIASSSLHGLICADSYNIPSIWLKFSDKIAGNGFKFMDYFSSVGRLNETSFIVDSKTTIQDIINKVKKYEIQIDLDLLLKAFPYENS